MIKQSYTNIIQLEQDIKGKFDRLARKSFSLDSYESLPLELSLKDEIGVDSLGIMSFYINIEQYFEVKIEGFQPERLNTLGDWQNLLLDALRTNCQQDEQSLQVKSQLVCSGSIKSLTDAELETLLTSGNPLKLVFRYIMQLFFLKLAALWHRSFVKSLLN